MTFSKNYLSNQSQPWAREVQKRVANLETAFRSAEVNNTTRDDQLAASFRRLDATFLETQQAAADAEQAANDALAAINGLTGLGTPGGDYEVDGANLVVGSVTATEISSQYVYAGQIDADQINAGTVIGLNIKTRFSGQRVELLDNDIEFYNSGNVKTGSIFGSSFGAENAIYIDAPNALVLQNGYQTFLIGDTGVFQGNFSVENDLQMVNGTARLDNRVQSEGTRNAITSASPNMYVATNGFFARSTSTSSREVKENIKPITFDYKKFLSVNPVTFDFKEGIITAEGEDAESTRIDQLGFIAEDFIEAGFEKHLIIQPNEFEAHIGLRYDKLYMFLHKTVQDLNQRVTELENG